VLDADLLVHVVDGSDANPMAQIEAVHQVIREVQIDHNAAPAPELLVVNKIDTAAELTLAQLRSALPGAVFVSAHTGDGIGRLLTRLGELVEPREVAVDVTVPYSRGDLVARIHDEGRVDATEHTPDGTRVKARVPAALAAAIGQYATG
jgi:GTP-binding protein HflX